MFNPAPKPFYPTAITILAICSLAVGCRNNPRNDGANDTVTEFHATTFALDRYDIRLAELDRELRGSAFKEARLALYAERWPTVERAVAHQGATHRDAFYGSRAYWHNNSTRGIGWALDHAGDLDDAFYIASRGNVRVTGDVNKDIEIAGNSIVHIYGDLDATLELKGVCEVIIAGNLTDDATIVCDGQLELFVGGNSKGVFGATSSATIVIDGNADGVIQCGAPATTLTVTGDLLGDVPPPKNKDAVLTLRVDGYAPTAKMLDLTTAGFTRVNATIGTSNAPPGLYPLSETATRPTARWVVLRQRVESD